MSTSTSTNPARPGIKPLASIETVPGNGALLVSMVSYPAGTELREVTGGTAQPSEVTLTSDGRHYDRGGWHTGQTAEDVRVERWTADGCVFHGFIDSVSRKLTQAG